MSAAKYEFLIDPDDTGIVERIRVSFLSVNPLTIATLSVVSAFGIRVLATAAARLGSKDRWDTNAGMRVAFEHLLDRAVYVKVPIPFLRTLRRAVQIELAIDRVDRRGKALDSAMVRAGKEHQALVEMRNRGYLGPDNLPAPGAEIIENPGAWMPKLYRPAARPYDSRREADARPGDILRKPDEYKSLNDGSSFPCFLLPKRDYTPSDQADGSGYEGGDEELPPNQTGR